MTILLFFVSLVCLIIGLAKPDKILFWKQDEDRTKKYVLKYFGTATIVFLILVPIFNSSGSTKTNTNVASNKTETVEKDEAKKQIETEQPKETKKLGWTQEKGNWYYYDNNNKPKKGWAKDNNKYYYFNSLGIMQTGWIKDSGKDYYCDNSGVLQTGWKQSNGEWYYLNTDGSMESNTTVDGYYLASNGAMQEKSTSHQTSATQPQNDGGYFPSSNQNQTVYVSKNGIYHPNPHAHGMKYYTPMSRADAEKAGYRACEKCY